MGCAESKVSVDAVAEPKTNPAPKSTPSLAKLDKLTSTAYSASNPPQDWQDTVFLVPHEWVRREMLALQKSVEVLEEKPTKEDNWKVLLFAKWLKEFFVVVIHMHHDNEEQIYLPMLKENGAVIPEEKMAKDHAQLVNDLNALEKIADGLLQGGTGSFFGGPNVQKEVRQLKAMVPEFVQSMLEHLEEEELQFPPIIRKANISLELHQATVQKIFQAGGITGLHTELPGVMEAMKDWGSDVFYEMFITKEIPPPIKELADTVFIPNYHNVYCPMRDAPTLTEKPELTEIPFEPSMLPAPPAAAEE